MEVLKTKNGKTVGLEDFKAGETVTARWQSTPNGHVIEALSVRQVKNHSVF